MKLKKGAQKVQEILDQQLQKSPGHFASPEREIETNLPSIIKSIETESKIRKKNQIYFGSTLDPRNGEEGFISGLRDVKRGEKLQKLQKQNSLFLNGLSALKSPNRVKYEMTDLPTLE